MMNGEEKNFDKPITKGSNDSELRKYKEKEKE
jgi:hypothetical protein